MTAQRYERIPPWTRGDRLRKARLLTGLNTHDFAELIGVSQKTINNAEGDVHGVRKIVMNAWAMATGVPVEWLDTGIGDETPTPTPPGQSDSDPLDRLTRAKRGRTHQREQPTTHRYVPAAA